MAFLRSQASRHLSRSLKQLDYPSLFKIFRSSRNYSYLDVHIPAHPRGMHSVMHYRCIVACSCMADSASERKLGSFEPYFDNKKNGISAKETRSMSTKAQVAPQQLRQGALRVTMLSPGFVFEPYKLREPIPFWRRWFTRSGWRRTKDDVVMELKNAYAVARLRKISGYSKKVFYQEAINFYKEINMSLANGDKASLRKMATEKMFSELKNDLKRRESIWSSVYWELVQPVVKIRTLRARLIGVDKNDLDKCFIQLTLEFLTKQKFEACDSNGVVVSGDKTKEVLVRDIWVFEKSLFHRDGRWRLCAKL